MKLISFDIGIKNMAYCLFSRDNTTQQWIIEKWNVLNLMDHENNDKNQKLKCSLCCKKAIYCQQKQNVFLCKKHAIEQKQWWLPSLENSWKTIKKEKMEILFLWAAKLSLTDYENQKRKILLKKIQLSLNEKLLEIISKQSTTTSSAKDVNLIYLGRNIMTELDKMNDEWNELTHVILENQISPIASRMKTVQGMISQYFIMRTPSTTVIEFVSSTNKLRGIINTNTNTDATTIEKIGKNNYKNNKLSSINYGFQLLEEHQLDDWKNWILTHKKKDDLFDAFLQGIAYMKKK
jgi:hypothetical protein